MLRVSGFIHDRTKEERNPITKTSSFQLSVILILPALIVASPSGYGGGCQTGYDTVYTQVCATAYDKKCQQSAKTEYSTEYDTKCETTYLKNCFPVPRQVPDQECRTEYDQVCTKNSKTTIETRTDTQCKDIVKKVSTEDKLQKTKLRLHFPHRSALTFVLRLVLWCLALPRLLLPVLSVLALRVAMASARLRPLAMDMPPSAKK